MVNNTFLGGPGKVKVIFINIRWGKHNEYEIFSKFQQNLSKQCYSNRKYRLETYVSLKDDTRGFHVYVSMLSNFDKIFFLYIHDTLSIVLKLKIQHYTIRISLCHHWHYVNIFLNIPYFNRMSVFDYWWN